MECHKCNNKVRKKGKYRINRTSVAQQKYYCRKCNYYFIERNEDIRKKIPMWIRHQILRLSKKEKGYIRRYDRSRKTTYSVREIARMLNISKSFVSQIIKNES